MNRQSVLVFVVLIPLVLAACGGNGQSTGTPRAIEPDDFVAVVDNPWFPLTPGTTYVYRGEEDGEPTRDVVTVTNATKVIQGVRCTVVHDNVYHGDELAERTADWYAQDKDGTVWYFGEATAELENGKVKSTEGSWRAGVDGAEAGIIMPSKPEVGQSFRQEYYKGKAEDHFQVLSVSSTVRVPYTSSNAALVTKEWTPLEPDIVEHKVYVRGIGNVKEEIVKGGNERSALVSVRR